MLWCWLVFPCVRSHRSFAEPDAATIAEFVRKDEEKISSIISVASTLNFGSDAATTGELRRVCAVRPNTEFTGV